MGSFSRQPAFPSRRLSAWSTLVRSAGLSILVSVLVCSTPVFASVDDMPTPGNPKMPLGVSRELIDLIQSWRTTEGEPPELAELGWTDWQHFDARCKGDTTVWDALAKNECGIELKKLAKEVVGAIDVLTIAQQKHIAEILKNDPELAKDVQLHDWIKKTENRPESFGEVAWETGEAAAAAFDWIEGPAMFRCLSKTLGHYIYDDGAEKERLFVLIDAGVDAISAYQFFDALSKMTTKGAQAFKPDKVPFEKGLGIGEAGKKSLGIAGGGANVTQIEGWKQTIAKAVAVPIEAWRTTHIGKMGHIRGLWDDAAQMLDDCDVKGAAKTYIEAKKEALSYLKVSREYVVSTEIKVYCSVPAVDELRTRIRVAGFEERLKRGSAEDLLFLYTHPASGAHPTEGGNALTYANEMQQEALTLYVSLLNDPRLKPAAFEAKQEELDAMIEKLEGVSLKLVDSLVDFCVHTDYEPLEDLQPAMQSSCYEPAEEAVFAEPTLHFLLERFRVREMARAYGIDAIVAAVDQTEDLMARCDYAGVETLFVEAAKDFDQSFAPEGFPIKRFWECPGFRNQTEFPREAAKEGKNRLVLSFADAKVALGPVQGLIGRCEWQEARKGLDLARDALNSVPCQASVRVCRETPDLCQRGTLTRHMQRLEFELEDQQADSELELAEAEKTAKTLLAEIEVELVAAESRKVDRCGALSRGRDMIDLLGAIQPQACPSELLDGLPQQIAAVEKRANLAQVLYLDELLDLQEEARQTGDDCDPVGLHHVIAEMKALPPICDFETADLIRALETRETLVLEEGKKARLIVDETHKATQKAWPPCDTAGLESSGAKAKSISRCGLNQLTDEQETVRWSVIERALDAPKIRTILGSLDPEVLDRLHFERGLQPGFGSGVDRGLLCRRQQQDARQRVSEARAILQRGRVRLRTDVHPDVPNSCTADLAAAIQTFERSIPEVCASEDGGAGTGSDGPGYSGGMANVAAAPKAGKSPTPGGSWSESKDQARQERQSSGHAQSSGDEASEGRAAVQSAADTDSLIRQAASAYANCDYGRASSYLSQIRVPNSRVGQFRSLIAQQRHSEAIYQDARARGDAMLAQMAVDAARPPNLSPPCQRMKAQWLATALSTNQAANEALAARERSQVAWAQASDMLAGVLIGALGDYNRAQRGEGAVSTGGVPGTSTSGGGSTSNPGGSSSSDDKCYVVDVPSHPSGASFVVQAFDISGSKAYYIYTWASNEECGTARSCLEAHLRAQNEKTTGQQPFRIISSHSSPSAAHQAAERLCGR